MKFLYTLVLILLSVTFAFPMSFFSATRDGVGSRYYVNSVRGEGMGGTGLALYDDQSLSAYNISTWRFITDTRISLGLRYLDTNIDLGSNSFNTSSSDFNGLKLAVPILKNKWVAGISLVPYSFVNFSYKQTISSPISDYDESVFFKGNISRAQVNLIWSPHPKLGLGASFNYYFGTINDRYLLRFNNSSYYDSSHEIEYEMYGPGAGLSFDWEPFDSLLVGGFMDFKPSLQFNQLNNSPVVGLSTSENTTAHFPVFWGVGSSYSLKSNWVFSADIAYQNLQDGFGIAGLPSTNLEKWYQAGIGLEHSHSKGLTRAFFKKFDIRTGFSFGTIGYKVNQNSVNEYKAHLGIGIPFFGGHSRFDIALVAGIRGDRTQTLAQEKFYGVTMSVSAGELWFQKIR